MGGIGAGLLGLILWGAAAGNPMDADVPTVTTSLESHDGAKVTFRYQAMHWGAAPYDMGAESGQESPSAAAQKFSAQMVSLTGNVQLRIGPTKLDPGTYSVGFLPAPPQNWTVVISQGDTVLAQLPIAMREEKETSEYLTVILRPGVTGKDFIFTCLYGNLSTSLRWTMTGVPVRGADGLSAETEAAPSGPDLYSGAAWQSTLGSVSPLTADPQPAPAGAVRSASAPERPALLKNRREPTLEKKPRAGSGVFRRMLNKEKNETP